MIYLIGGPPRSGKTILAKKMASALGISFFSLDSLEVILIKIVSSKEFKKNFSKSYLTQKTKGNFDMIYNKYSDKQVMDCYIKQGIYIGSLIENMIDRELWEGNDFIIEGYQILPSVVAKLIRKFGSKKIKSVFIIKTNPKKFIEDEKRGPKCNNWIRQHTIQEETIKKIAQMICLFGKFFENEAKKHGFKIFNMDSNFDKQIKKAIGYSMSVPRSSIYPVG